MTEIYRIHIFMKSGNVIEGRFTEFEWKGSPGTIKHLTWKTAPGFQLVFINVSEIECITSEVEK